MNKDTHVTLVVSTDDPLCRIDQFLFFKFPKYSRSYFQHLIERECITLNGAPVKKREKPQAGDLLQIHFYSTQPQDILPENLPIKVLYEDESLVAIDKPRGMVIHPAPGHPNHTLVNAILYHYKDIQGQDPLRPGIVHRLDKDTSGVLLIAKTREVHASLSKAFKERKVFKEYIALCIGNPGFKTLCNHLGRDPKNRQKIGLVQDGKEAISHIETLHYTAGYSWVKVLPATGRTHQIRVHLQSVGCPILGDPLYGNLRLNHQLEIHTQLLHAYKLSFKHPLSGESLTLCAEIPLDMQIFKKRLLSLD